MYFGTALLNQIVSDTCVHSQGQGLHRQHGLCHGSVTQGGNTESPPGGGVQSSGPVWLQVQGLQQRMSTRAYRRHEKKLLYKRDVYELCFGAWYYITWHITVMG